MCRNMNAIYKKLGILVFFNHKFSVSSNGRLSSSCGIVDFFYDDIYNFVTTLINSFIYNFVKVIKYLISQSNI